MCHRSQSAGGSGAARSTAPQQRVYSHRVLLSHRVRALGRHDSTTTVLLQTLAFTTTMACAKVRQSGMSALLATTMTAARRGPESSTGRCPMRSATSRAGRRSQTCTAVRCARRCSACSAADFVGVSSELRCAWHLCFCFQPSLGTPYAQRSRSQDLFKCRRSGRHSTLDYLCTDRAHACVRTTHLPGPPPPKKTQLPTDLSAYAGTHCCADQTSPQTHVSSVQVASGASRLWQGAFAAHVHVRMRACLFAFG